MKDIDNPNEDLRKIFQVVTHDDAHGGECTKFVWFETTINMESPPLIDARQRESLEVNYLDRW